MKNPVHALRGALADGDIANVAFDEFDARRHRVAAAIDQTVQHPHVKAARQQAFAIYTRMAGRRDVQMRHTAKAVHFIDNVGGMYLLTTVHNCLDYDDRHGVCLTYGATHARVFDAAVVRDPDAVYEKIKAGAEPGFCDHSFIGIQEAAKSR